MLSLTDMWRAAGKPENKDPSQWRKLTSVLEFCDHVSSNMGLSHIELIQAVRGGEEAGTWAHWQIAMAYAPSRPPKKQKPLQRAASDLVALDGTTGISWIIDVGGMHSTQDGLHRPSTPGSLAPVVVTKA